MATAQAERTRIRPASRIGEREGVVTLALEMPGVDRESVEISVEGETLTITGKRPEPAADATYLVRERRRGEYRAVYTLDERVNPEKVDARMEHGILHLTLHLKDEAKPRKIEIAE